MSCMGGMENSRKPNWGWRGPGFGPKLRGGEEGKKKESLTVLELDKPGNSS